MPVADTGTAGTSQLMALVPSLARAHDPRVAMKGRLLPTSQKHLYRLLPLVFVQKWLSKPQGIASRSPRATGISIGMRGRPGIKTCNAIGRTKGS